LIGSPQQVIDKVSRYHEQLGHEVIHLSADADGVTGAKKRRSLELFQADVASSFFVTGLPRQAVGRASRVGKAVVL